MDIDLLASIAVSVHRGHPAHNDHTCSRTYTCAQRTLQRSAGHSTSGCAERHTYHDLFNNVYCNNERLGACRPFLGAFKAVTSGP
jgi:hypothetical protein